MKRIEEDFKYKGVTFKIVKRGKKAIMLDAKASFYTCKSIEVWQIRESKGSVIGESLIEPHEKKPSNEDYPYSAHQFMENHYKGGYSEMMQKAEKRFNEYETGIRPKRLTEFD